uniref:TM2 domain containing 1 n=1 Tax=Oreochromis niloticus TaxID=8128 RepID=A0A669DDW5_ORENI
MVCRAFPVLHHSEFPACCKSVKVPPCHVIEGIMASSRRRLLCVRSGALSLLFYCVYSHLQLVLSEEAENCQNLRLGQYKCNDPKIDESTQEPENCRDMTAWVECLPAPNISCRLSNGTVFRFSGDEVGFNKSIPCRNVIVEVLHCWFLWDRHTHRLHIDRHADRGSSGWIELHRGLLRCPSDPSVHHQRDFQEATSLSVTSPGCGLRDIYSDRSTSPLRRKPSPPPPPPPHVIVTLSSTSSPRCCDSQTDLLFTCLLWNASD